MQKLENNEIDQMLHDSKIPIRIAFINQTNSLTSYRYGMKKLMGKFIVQHKNLQK